VPESLTAMTTPSVGASIAKKTHNLNGRQA